MSFFQSKTKRKTSSGSNAKRGGRSNAKKKSGKSEWDVRRTARGLMFLAMVGGVVGVSLAWHHGSQAIKGHVRQNTPPEILPAHIDLMNAPSWMTDAWQRQVCLTVAKYVSADPFDSRSLSIAAQALNLDPLVKQVVQVRRVAGGRIQVFAEYRSPLALVETGNFYLLVDDEGVVLPTVYEARHLKQVDMPVILGVASQPPMNDGARWMGRDLQAGLELAALIEGETFSAEVLSIDVSHYQGDHLQLYLITEAGPVLWGMPPGQELMIEAEADLKLARLRNLYEQRQSIASPGRLVKVNGPTSQGTTIGALN